MNSLEQLKEELKTQKEILEQVGVDVVVANTNPSPAEITESLKRLEIPNLTLSTATEEDVLAGKTFYSGDSVLKTGVRLEDSLTEYLNAFVYYISGKKSTERQFYVTLNQEDPIVRRYMFYTNYHNIELTLNPNTEEIQDYAFGDTPNLTFTNLNQLTKLTTLGDGVFLGKNCIDWENLPPVTITGNRAFQDTCYNNTKLILPPMQSIGSYCFASTTERKILDELDASKITARYLTSNMLYQLSFRCDFTVPSCVAGIDAEFMYKGCFNNLIIPSTVQNIASRAFGSVTSDSLDHFFMKSVVFLGNNPPYIYASSFATQFFENGMKFYVPDEAIDTYKSYSPYSSYANYIHPMSERP
ncbi:MAG: leucine-rich repeat protein [Clostridia bacterium]|nr:leucine-rich repeat protein [Clostridia bacterium]